MLLRILLLLTCSSHIVDGFGISVTQMPTARRLDQTITNTRVRTQTWLIFATVTTMAHVIAHVYLLLSVCVLSCA